MGQFSWCTSDTRKSIPCTYDVYQGAPSTVYLLNPFGEPYKESDYDGYGEFGGRDVFELVAEWNRKYLTAANIEKPTREQWPKGSEGDMFYNRAVKRYKGACEAIDAYVRGASDEVMQERYGRYLSYMRDGHDWKRCLGIAISSNDAWHVKLRYPIKIVENPCAYEKAGISPHCPRQGYFYEDGREAIQQSVDKVFERLSEAQEKHMGEKIDVLCDFFWKSHMEDMIVFEDTPGHLIVRDEDETQWEEGEIYDFVLNECLGFEPDGKLQFGYGAISQELADTLKAHAAQYDVFVDVSETPDKQYTLEYLNDAGDIITRDYFPTSEEAIQFAQDVLNTYNELGNETVCGLCITDDQGGTVWEATVNSVAIEQADIEYNFETADGAVGHLVDVTNEEWYKNPSMTLYDELEYDCWDLVCKYAELIGLHLEKEEIDFNLAKTVQESVMNLLEKEVGVEFPVHGKEVVAKNTLADKIAKAEEKGRGSASDRAASGIEVLEER